MIDRAKYLERQRRYNCSEKGRARQARYEETRIQTRIAGGLISTSYRVPAGTKAYFQAEIAEFCLRQRDAYREAAARGFDDELLTEVTG